MDSWIERLDVRFLRILTSSAQSLCPIHLVDYLQQKSTAFSLIQTREMTIVLLQILAQIEKRVVHWIRILSCCPQIPMRCRWTSTWRWSVQWISLMLRSILTVTLGLCDRAAMWWIMGRCSTRVPFARHQFCPKLSILVNFWTTPICVPMHRLIEGSRVSYQDTIQNLKRRRTLCGRNWWLVHLQSKANTSMKSLPS